MTTRPCAPNSFIAVAAEWNSQGATMLAQKRVGMALQSFRRALETLSCAAGPNDEVAVAAPGEPGRMASSPVRSTNDTGAAAEAAAAEAAASTTSAVIPKKNRTSRPRAPSNKFSSAGNDPDALLAVDSDAAVSMVPPSDHFVYTEALVFDAGSAAAAPSYLPLYCSVVEFNLALAFQMMPCADGSNERALTKSLRLYDRCLAHVQQALVNTTRTTDGNEYANIIVAAMNNQALILYEWACYDRVREMYSSLMEIMLASDDGRALPGFTQDHVQGILLNVLLMRGNKLAPAA